VTTAIRIESPGSWLWLACGVLGVFILFQWSATALGSDRGQAGLAVGAIVTAATLIVERAGFSTTWAGAARAVGFGAPGRSAMLVAAAVSVLLLLTVPVYVVATDSRWSMHVHWWQQLPGLFAQAGVAEEVLFRGYLFRSLRAGRSFWRAASLSMLPFVAVHLLMFSTMPWPVAVASLLLAVVISFPMAHLFELGNATIWAPALLHFVVQGTVKSIDVDGGGTPAFPLVWIAASAVVPALAMFVRRPAPTGTAL
jgi:membrane protease YdiL (CAAX protease family)